MMSRTDQIYLCLVNKQVRLLQEREGADEVAVEFGADGEVVV